MAPPKRRTSKSKRNMRRSHHSRQVSRPALAVCPRCGAPKLAHRVCIHCGHYCDREVVKMDQI